MALSPIAPHDANAGACIICLDSDPPPIQSGCACRSDGGLAHVGCIVETAVAQQPHRGNAVWWKCQTCGQGFTGAMKTGLAEAWWSRVCDQAEESEERLAAATNLAQSHQSKGKYAEAERIYREALSVYRRVLGDEHLATLNTAACLAQSLWQQAKHAHAERIQREVLGVYKRVLGEEHHLTLNSAHNLAVSLAGQRKYGQAEQIEREVLGGRRRVLGEEHPETLSSVHNLAQFLSFQGQHAAAEELLQATLDALRRVLGSAHPDTVNTAHGLEYVRSQMRAKPPTRTGGNAGAPTARAAPHCLPAGTRVLVQRLVAKPEYNGMRARVLSFDESKGRYRVVLDDGKELSLKAECVARAGCAAAGCASAEASSVCGRCEEVRYCSRECQRADWKAHKPACAAP
jgi:tetratricopeptide (TPR) repeat protein